MKKKLHCLILIFTFLIVTLLPFSVSAANGGFCGEYASWVLDDIGTLTIRGTQEMYDYPSKNPPWLEHGDSVRCVKIMDGVTSIGSFAFYNCRNLETVYISDTVTSISDNAFFNSGIKSITVPKGVTSLGNFAFSNCHSLESIAFLNTLTSIDYYAFSGCESLKEVTLPESLSSFAPNTFSSCPALKSINIDEENAYFASQNGVLFDKNKETLIKYPQGKTETSYSVPDGATALSSYAFEGAYNLKEIILPASLSSLGSFSFRDCESLESIVIPDSVTTLEGQLFYGCNNLKEITIPKSVVSVSKQVFEETPLLQKITVDAGSENYCSESGVLYNTDKTTLIKYPSGKSDSHFLMPDSVTRIESRAFKESNSLESVFLPKSVTYIGSSAFDGCSSLEAVLYGGTSSLKENITLEGLNDPFKKADFEYNVLTSSSISDNSITILPHSIEEGSFISLAIYDGKTLSGIYSWIYEGEEKFEETLSVSFDSVKVMVWESAASLKPISLENVPVQ